MFSVSSHAAELKWVGCGISKKAFMNALAKAYQQKTGTLIKIGGGGATKGIRHVASGKAHMGGSCRHKIMAHEETNSRLIPVGWDSIVMITHKSNPVKNLTSDQLKRVLTGNITDWGELGGPNAPLKLGIRKGKISGVGLMTRQLLFQDPNLDFTEKAEQFKSSGPLEKFVENEPLALAVTGISSARKRNVNILALDTIEPSYTNVAKGTYPLHRPLYLVVPKDSTKEIRSFVTFIKTAKGQEIIKKQGTVNMKDGRALWKSYRKRVRDARKKSGKL